MSGNDEARMTNVEATTNWDASAPSAGVILSEAKDLPLKGALHQRDWATQTANVRFLASLGMTG
jgi:hypothetical protein